MTAMHTTIVDENTIRFRARRFGALELSIIPDDAPLLRVVVSAPQQGTTTLTLPLGRFGIAGLGGWFKRQARRLGPTPEAYEERIDELDAAWAAADPAGEIRYRDAKPSTLADVITEIRDELARAVADREGGIQIPSFHLVSGESLQECADYLVDGAQAGGSVDWSRESLGVAEFLYRLAELRKGCAVPRRFAEDWYARYHDTEAPVVRALDSLTRLREAVVTFLDAPGRTDEESDALHQLCELREEWSTAQQEER